MTEGLVDEQIETASGHTDSASAPGVHQQPFEIAEKVAVTCAAVAAVPDILVACGQLLPLLVDASGAKRASIMLINPDTGRLMIANAFGLPFDLTGRDLEFRPRSIAEWVVRNQRPLILNGAVKEERFEGCDRTIESALSLPIEGFDGPVGVVNLARPAPGRVFDEAEMIGVARLVYPIGVAVERVYRAVMGEHCLRQLKAGPEAWVNTQLPEGASASRNFEFGFARVPCAREAGDLCVRIPHGNGGQTLMAVDSSAVGVASAVMTAFTHGMLAATATPERSAVALVARLNAGLHGRLAPGRHLAVWVAQLSGSGQLSYCNAGMAPPLWVPADDNAPRPLEAGGPVAGALPQADYREETLQLLPGDLVVAASNGVLHSRDGTGVCFGDARLSDLVTELRRQPLERLTRAVCEAARSFGGRPVPTDDLTVFALRYTPPGD
jgi:hypothetical protein